MIFDELRTLWVLFLLLILSAGHFILKQTQLSPTLRAFKLFRALLQLLLVPVEYNYQPKARDPSHDSK